MAGWAAGFWARSVNTGLDAKATKGYMPAPHRLPGATRGYSVSESKSSVLNIRLAPPVLEKLTQRAADERRPIRQLAALLIEDALNRPRLAQAAPLVVPAKTPVEPFFRPAAKKKGKGT